MNNTAPTAFTGFDDELVELAVNAVTEQGPYGIARIATSGYFTMDYLGDELLVDETVVKQIEAKLGEKLVEKVFPGFEGLVNLVAASRA